MNSNQTDHRFSNKRLFIFTIAIIGVCFYFWTQSRYPALNKKALMGGRTIMGSIVFDIFYPIYVEDSLIMRILKTTVNWYYTNWKGMTFGLIFSGLIISTLSMFKFRRFKNSYLNTLFGMVLGAPLGVCANCAAPISRSLYETTKSIETTLSSLFSSPALNFVVLAMAFQLLPFEMAITKVVSTMVMILVVAPLLGVIFTKSPNHLENLEKEIFCEIPKITKDKNGDFKSESWINAVFNSVKSFAKSLFYICKIALPMMLLAGFLGAVIIEIVPLNSLINLKLSFFGAILIALVGTFLPVPMSFDVVIVAILVDGGLNPVYGMILLFTLGVFSVYPFMVMWRTINLKFASSIFASVVIVGLLGAASVPLLMQRNSNYLLEVFNSEDNNPISATLSYTKKSCLTLPAPEMSDCVFLIANGINREEVCDLITEKKYNSRCHAKYFGARIDDINGGDCSTLPDDDSRKQCAYVYKNQVYENVKFTISRVCGDKIRNNDSEVCYNFRVFQELLPITACENYKNPLKVHDCFKYNWRNLDLKKCSALKTMVGQASCQYWVANNDLVKKNETTDQERIKIKKQICAQSSNKEYQDYCNSFYLMNYAAHSNNPETCEHVTKELRNACKAVSFAGVASYIYVKKIKNNLLESNFDKNEVNLSKGEQVPLVKVLPVEMKREFSQANIHVSAFPLNAKKYNGSGFDRLEGRDIGIILPHSSITDMLRLPLWVSRGMASGDFNSDGRQDLVFATSEGPYLYSNLGGLKFQKTPINLEGILKKDIDLSAVSFIDINNDGFLDIYCASVNGAAYFLLSKNFTFNELQRIDLPNLKNRNLAQTTAFGDIDKNGWLDVFLGNNPPWTLMVRTPEAENELIMNNHLKWSSSSFYKDEVLGLTMTSLMSDINQDGQLDLWIGNDLVQPDQILMGKTNGKFSEVKKSDKIIPGTPDASMSYDSGDVNNDLILDVFDGGVDSDPKVFSSKSGYCNFIKNKIDLDKCLNNEDVLAKINYFDPDVCKTILDLDARSTCFASIFMRSAIVQKKYNLCRVIPESNVIWKNCQKFFNSFLDSTRKRTEAEELSQVTRNVLLIQNKNGTFEDVAKKWGVANTGWAWNSKFNDYNNDGWLDLYVSTGFLNFRMIGNNFLFINKEGRKFENKTKEYGIEEVYSSFSHVGVDLLNNGNLNIVATSLNGPVRFYMNQSANNSISFNLRQSPKLGNTSAIGARIIITNNENASQIREVKASGGFLSFGPYVQHFGLNKSKGVKSVKIIWPDGFVTNLEKPFRANHEYLIERD